MGRALDLLIVDDDPSQVQLMRTIVQELGLPHRCHSAPNGFIALDFLNRRAPFENAPRPHLILLDLNMPGMNGREVLRSIKGDARFRSIPTIMLSNSDAANDIEACYGQRANAYIQKPADLEGNLRVVLGLDRFWSGTARLADLGDVPSPRRV